jgi:hypothetical protein
MVQDTVDSGEPPLGWEWESEPTEVEGDIALLGEELSEAMSSLRLLEGYPALQSFVHTLEYADDECPRIDIVEEESGHTSFFNNLCQAESGIWFKGPATWAAWEEGSGSPFVPLVADGLLWTGMGFNGQTDIFSEDGLVDFNCSCTMVSAHAIDPDSGTRYAINVASGISHWTGDADEGSWMESSDVVPDVHLSARDSPRERRIEGWGAVSGLGERWSAFTYEFDLQISVSDPSECVAALLPTFTVRHSDTGEWFELALAQGEGCSYCAELHDQEVCVDMSGLLNWGELPWR